MPYRNVKRSSSRHRKSWSGAEAAVTFVEEFNRQLDLVCGNPEMHALSRMPELAARGYRTTLVNSYAMVYCAIKDDVYVAHVSINRRITHGWCNLVRHLLLSH